MKYLHCFLVMFMAAAICFPAFGADVSLGAEGGLCLSKFSGSDSRGWDSKTDVCGYGFLNLPIQNQWSILCEAGYAAKGSYESYSDITNDFTYLEIPLLLRYMVQSTSSYRTSLYAGPAFGYLLSAQQSTSTTGTTDLNAINSSDIGASVGGILELPTNFGSVLFDVRYTQGFTKPMSKYNSYNLNNSVLSIMVGLSFNLSGSSSSGASHNTENAIQ